jgi:hypothetical protein
MKWIQKNGGIRACSEGGSKDEGNNDRIDMRWKSNTRERKETDIGIKEYRAEGKN